MFLDDDIKFNNDAFKKMYSFINKMSDNIAGVGFNSITPARYEKKLIERIKNSSFFSRLGLYHSRPGVVTTSGWQTKILNIKKDIKKYVIIFFIHLIKQPTVQLKSLFMSCLLYTSPSPRD